MKNAFPSRADSPADLKGFTIPAGNGKQMYACLFKPHGSGPRPTILLLHGYPGDENNFDLAHAFQRVGYVTVVFHYRGTWGSEGQFSLCHVLEDVSSALGFIRSLSGDEAYQFDAHRLILIGHSMGGFAALETAAADSGFLGVGAVAAFDFSLAAGQKNLRAAVRREFENSLPIYRIGLDSLMGEIDENAAHWSFPTLAEGLSRLPVCLIAGENDEISLPKYHFTPLYQSLRQNAGSRVTAAILKDGHCFCEKRVKLQARLLEWISGLLRDGT